MIATAQCQQDPLVICTSKVSKFIESVVGVLSARTNPQKKTEALAALNDLNNVCRGVLSAALGEESQKKVVIEDCYPLNRQVQIWKDVCYGSGSYYGVSDEDRQKYFDAVKAYEDCIRAVGSQ